MNKREKKLWGGLSESAVRALAQRDYRPASLGQRVVRAGVDGGQLAGADRSKPDIKKFWIPGVEIFRRDIYSQPHRGVFGEFVRQDKGILATIGLWPKQWSAARM